MKDDSENKIAEMKRNFILALKDLSRSVELNSQYTETGHFKNFSKEENRLIKKLRTEGMNKSFGIAQKLKEINRFKDLHYLLEDPDPIVVTYYCKYNYPEYREIFIPILFNIYKDIDFGPLNLEVALALSELRVDNELMEKIKLEKRKRFSK